jgi:hypothetical protein
LLLIKDYSEEGLVTNSPAAKQAVSLREKEKIYKVLK